MGVVIEKLKEILACPHVCGRTNPIINIEEENNSSSRGDHLLEKIQLTDVADDMFLIKPDKATKVKIDNRSVNCISPLNKIGPDISHNRACDAILIKEEANLECKLVYIELKSLNYDGAATQIKSADCFIDYLASVLNQFYDIKVKLKKKFIILHTARPRSIDKRNTSRRASNAPNCDITQPTKRIVKNKEKISVAGLI